MLRTICFREVVRDSIKFERCRQFAIFYQNLNPCQVAAAMYAATFAFCYVYKKGKSGARSGYAPA